MGRRCCIAGCTSTSRLPEHHGVTYHSFPLDAGIRAVWLRNTRLSSERQITKSVLVCSRHFRRADFQPQRSGKYLLKQRVFPTVFPWGKVDPSQVEIDLRQLKSSGGTGISTTASTVSTATPEVTSTATTPEEDITKATVEATVAQIMAQTAELNAAAKSSAIGAAEGETSADTNVSSAATMGVKFEPVTSFNPGARLEAQDFDGVWHMARVVEVDNDDREVLIKFERTGKTKSAVVGTEEWIPMNSARLRQKISTRPVPVFELEEKCMARWSGPRKFPGTVKKVLSNDTYEVLFDDGYVKNVRAIHMTKVVPAEAETSASASLITTPTAAHVAKTPNTSVTSAAASKPLKSDTPPLSGAGSSKKRTLSIGRKDWPLLDLSKLDLTSLNLPDIPRDGEWTCHWVNDQPIGREGYLIVGEHRKPTVVVEDWRLPPGWIKHMYQRSNVLGKWDVILVTPNGKRFRSKADLKIFLEEQGQVYNPDIYDFSIHRRRAKDINAYVHTADYKPQHVPKPRPTLDDSLDTSATSGLDLPTDASAAAAAAVLTAKSSSQFMETPVATPVPPMELMTTTTPASKAGTENTDNLETVASSSTTKTSTKSEKGPTVEDGFAYIGGLKVQIVDNLFRCPQEGCSKNFRKENHLQIHVKHYHADLNKLLGACPKMQELAEKRTHTTTIEPSETHPKNQISNQQFFAKLHQQDVQQQQTRAMRRSHPNTPSAPGSSSTAVAVSPDNKTETTDSKSESIEMESLNVSGSTNEEDLTLTTTNTTLEQTTTKTLESPLPSPSPATTTVSGIPSKRARFSPSKRAPGSRKSNRQRTTRRYLTAAQATAGTPLPPVVTADSSFGVSEFEETRHSFNATPDASKVLTDTKKRKTVVATAASVSSLDSPVTADSGSSSFQPLQAPSSNEAEIGAVQPQYIKENGELIKIVRMRQEEIINCLCSFGEEDGLMIQCELCLCWQHGGCNGIDKESDVPEKYVCYICRNPQRGRESLRYKHDQDWLYEGKLPVANYHITNPNLGQRFEFLKKSHTLTGNLVELKQFMHSLRVKINIANNRVHPKLYLWAKKWDEETEKSYDVKNELEVKQEIDAEMKSSEYKGIISGRSSAASTPSKKIKLDTTSHNASPQVPNIPLPEAPIDPAECQHRLLEHIKVQQNLVLSRLADIEHEVDALEQQDTLLDMKQAEIGTTKEVLATFIKELDIMKQISKLNSLEHTKQNIKQQLAIK